ncbi:hypothetical protein Patl_3767 [Paraglaciecola sp. T6c]|uniref:exosortase/archaeosortase family protein n=1 Tax=Pseudoalteromonas atlantica (strain T6c / ATCC BAA-1087) TaxID=3042615 RepID=UPI00005C7386|nr:exosortase/archaeosortase family protein [Paraglaciecola sp. T6c]ABG42267.1 hypothetical protein Patl_3767 [Paraglaciecola sp. T6c]
MKLYLLKLSLALILGFTLLKAPFMGPTIDNFCLLLAQITYQLISPFDANVMINESVYYWGSYTYAIEVTKECSALGTTMTLIVAILLFPANWKIRIQTVFLAFIFIQGINIFRLSTLLYGRVLFAPEGFNILHYHVFPFLLSLFSILFFIAYAGRFNFLCSKQKSVIQG